MQETWKIPYIDLVQIPGYHPLEYIDRNIARGGGVGFYIHSTIKFKRLHNFHSTPKTFENIVIEIPYLNRKTLLSCIYRSPNPNPGVSVTDHNNEFMQIFDNHL
jgi:hypothetical protein